MTSLVDLHPQHSIQSSHRHPYQTPGADIASHSNATSVAFSPYLREQRERKKSIARNSSLPAMPSDRPSRRASLSPQLLSLSRSRSPIAADGARTKPRFSWSPAMFIDRLIRWPLPPTDQLRSKSQVTLSASRSSVAVAARVDAEPVSAVVAAADEGRSSGGRPALQRGSTVPLPAEKIWTQQWAVHCVHEEPELTDSPEGMPPMPLPKDEMVVSDSCPTPRALPVNLPLRSSTSASVITITPRRNDGICAPSRCSTLCASVSSHNLSLPRLDTTPPKRIAAHSAPTSPTTPASSSPGLPASRSAMCQRVWLCTPPLRCPSSLASSPSQSTASLFDPSSTGRRRPAFITRASSTPHLAHIDENGTVVCVSVHSDKVLAKGVTPDKLDQQRRQNAIWEEAKAQAEVESRAKGGKYAGRGYPRRAASSMGFRSAPGGVVGLVRSQSAQVPVVSE